MSFVSHNETQESRNKYDMQHKKTQGITNDLHIYIYKLYESDASGNVLLNKLGYINGNLLSFPSGHT